MACWGWDDDGQSTPPAHAPGAFAQVSAGHYHTCALWTDGTAVCWGNNTFEQAPRLTLDPPPLPGGTEGSYYFHGLGASGGTGLYTFSLVAGSLPPGLDLFPDGILDGTLTAGGIYTFTIRATDFFTLPFSGRRDYAIVVRWPHPVFLPQVLRQ